MTLSTRDKTLLIAVLALAVLIGGWYFLIRPVQADVSAKGKELDQIQSEVGQRRDEVARLSTEPESHVERTVERLWLAKAVPVADQTAGAVIELQRLADQAGVELAAVRTTSRITWGGLEGTQYEVDVVGRFYNVDDFLYRIHTMVEMDDGDAPDIEGRLFATTKVDIGLESVVGGQQSGGTQLAPTDQVRAKVTVVAFNEAAAGSATAADATAAAAAPGASTAAPATGTTAAPAGTTTAPAGGTTTAGATTAPAGTTTPSTGTTTDPGAQQTTAQPAGEGGTSQ